MEGLHRNGKLLFALQQQRPIADPRRIFKSSRGKEIRKTMSKIGILEMPPSPVLSCTQRIHNNSDSGRIESQRLLHLCAKWELLLPRIKLILVPGIRPSYHRNRRVDEEERGSVDR